MGYNHAKAEKKFYREWREKLRLYKSAGMSMEQILALYKFDKAKLRSDRRFYEHCESIQYEETNPLFAEEAVSSPDNYDMNNWTAALPDKLCARLEKIPEEWLKAFYLYRVYGYTQKEISSILLKPRRTIGYWIVQVTEIVDEFKKSCQNGGA